MLLGDQVCMQTNKGLSDSVIFLEKRHPENVIMYFFYKKSPKKNSTLKTILGFFWSIL